MVLQQRPDTATLSAALQRPDSQLAQLSALPAGDVGRRVMHTETTVVAVAVAFTRAIGPLLGVRGGKGVSVWAEGPAVSESCPLHSILQPWQTCALSQRTRS